MQYFTLQLRIVFWAQSTYIFFFFHESHSHDKLLNVTGCNKWSAFPTLLFIGWPKCQSSARSKRWWIHIGSVTTLYQEASSAQKSTHTAAANILHIQKCVLDFNGNRKKNHAIFFLDNIKTKQCVCVCEMVNLHRV